MIAGVTNGSHFSAVNWSSTASFQIDRDSDGDQPDHRRDGDQAMAPDGAGPGCVEQDGAHRDTAHRRSSRLAPNEISSTMMM